MTAMNFHLSDIPSLGDFYFNSLPNPMLYLSSENSPPKFIETPKTYPTSSPTYLVEDTLPNSSNNKIVQEKSIIGDFYFDTLPLNLQETNEKVGASLLDPFSYQSYSKRKMENDTDKSSRKKKKDLKQDLQQHQEHHQQQGFGSLDNFFSHEIFQNLDQNSGWTGLGMEIKHHLKRGPKYMSKEERELSKSDHLRLYQNIWRLLFRKNSTVVLSPLGTQCCSFYAHGRIDKCPSGKSDIFDFFRTAEHIWKVIEMSEAIQERTYALEHFFFMKLLLPWKLQPRFTPCPSRPDVEPLENDRIFQKGKIRGQTYDKQTRDLKSKMEIRDLEEQKEKVFKELQCLEKISGKESFFWDMTVIPRMELVFQVLKKSIETLEFGKILLWPNDPSQISHFLSLEEECLNDETFGLQETTFPSTTFGFQMDNEIFVRRTLLQCSKVLSSYGSLIRKCSKFNVERGPLLKNPPIHVPYVPFSVPYVHPLHAPHDPRVDEKIVLF